MLKIRHLNQNKKNYCKLLYIYHENLLAIYTRFLYIFSRKQKYIWIKIKSQNCRYESNLTETWTSGAQGWESLCALCFCVMLWAGGLSDRWGLRWFRPRWWCSRLQRGPRARSLSRSWWLTIGLLLVGRMCRPYHRRKPWQFLHRQDLNPALWVPCGATPDYPRISHQ